MKHSITETWRGCALGAVALLIISSGVAHAQDSVGGVLGGRCGGGSGLDCNDSEDQFDTGPALTTEQPYVVDLGQRFSTWGNFYGYAPIIKSGRNSDPSFFTNLISAQAASMCFDGDTSGFRYADYYEWAAQGQGVGTSATIPAPVSDNVFRFGAGFAEFGDQESILTPGAESNNIVSGVVEFTGENPNRLFVTRYESAINRESAAVDDNAQVGFGGVDELGNPVFRADDFLAGSPNPMPIFGNNWIAVDNLLRTAGALNVLRGTGGGPNTSSDAGATTYMSNNSGTTHNTPTVISCTGGTSVVGGGRFDGNYGFGPVNVAGITSTGLHRPGTTDQRGNMAFTHTFTALGDGANDAGTMATYSRIGGATSNTSLSLFGVNTDGSVDGTVLIPYPIGAAVGSIIDPIPDPVTGNTYDPRNHNLAGDPEPNDDGNYGQLRLDDSQTAFRGGNGQIALAGDRNDPDVLYLAITVSRDPITGSGNPLQYLAAGRFDASLPVNLPTDIGPDNPTWTVAAWNNVGANGTCNEIFGKAVVNGPAPGNQVVGRLTTITALTGTLVPSMSAPMINQDGDIYFVSIWSEWFDTDTNGIPCDEPGPDPAPFTDLDSALFKAHRDPVTGGYQLEMLFTVGKTVFGLNSQTRWQLQFMGISDSNSIGSNAPWSSNIVQDRFFTPNPNPGAPVVPLGEPNEESFDAFDMGGLVLNMQITYDVDTNGMFENPTSGGAAGTEADEAYAVLMYVRGLVRTGACCVPGDCVDTTSTGCVGLGGSFNGVGTVCEFTDCTAGGGEDCWVTTDCGRPGQQGTLFSFADDPIPAGFFGPGSDPFNGTVPLGNGAGGGIDTRVQRLADLELPDPTPVTDTVAIQLTQLSLVSCDPIIITFNGGQNPTLFDVQVDLAGTQPQGQLTVTRDSPNGGTFETDLPVQPVFTFTEAGNPGNVVVFDTAIEGIPPAQLLGTEPAPWTTNSAFDTCSPGDGFDPGVTPAQECVEACHSSFGTAPHQHCVRAPDCPDDCAAHDVDCSGTTNAVDIGVVRAIANFNKDACPPTPVGAAVRRADVDRGGNVNAVDIGVIRAIANFNTSTGPCTCGVYVGCP